MHCAQHPTFTGVVFTLLYCSGIFAFSAMMKLVLYFILLLPPYRFIELYYERGSGTKARADSWKIIAVLKLAARSN